MSMPLTLAPAASFLVTVCLQVRQVFGAAAYDSSSMLLSAVDTIKPGDVYLRLADAVQLLEWAWTGFVPGGTAMVADEVKQQQHLVHRENHRHQQHSEDKGEGKLEVQSSQVPHPPGSPEALLQNYMQDCVVTYDDLYADDVDDNYFDDD